MCDPVIWDLTATTSIMSSRSASGNSKSGDEKSDNEDQVPNISSAEVSEKYKTAARITNGTHNL